MTGQNFARADRKGKEVTLVMLLSNPFGKYAKTVLKYLYFLTKDRKPFF